MKRISQLIFLCAVLALFAAPAWAAGVNVSTAADLQNAVNTNGNVINITADITLTTTISINKSVTINGNNHSISGNDACRVFYITGAIVEINDLTIKDGKVTGDSDYGGGMFFEKGIATVTNCTFAGNTAATDNGGGMYVDNNGTVTVTNCTFTGNTAKGGGGMHVNNGTATVINCTFADNTANDNNGG